MFNIHGVRSVRSNVPTGSWRFLGVSRDECVAGRSLDVCVLDRLIRPLLVFPSIYYFLGWTKVRPGLTIGWDWSEISVRLAAERLEAS